jgi:hypothetical protein
MGGVYRLAHAGPTESSELSLGLSPGSHAFAPSGNFRFVSELNRAESEALHRRAPDPCEIVPTCPFCQSGPFRFARRMKNIDICICEFCGTRLSVPHDAWEIRLGGK